MAKEVVFTIPPNKSEPYRTYYTERNGGVAVQLAQIMGYGYFGLVNQLGGEQRYFVPPKTISLEEMKSIGIADERDFYGLAISDERLVDKQILHVSMVNVDQREQRFAEMVESTVLPGIRTTGKELVVAVEQGLKNFGRVRVKKVAETGGLGQEVISEPYQLNTDAYKDDESLIVEADLTNKKTLSVGTVILPKGEYAFLAHQTTGIDFVRGNDRYLGADPIRVIAGSIGDLLRLDLTEEERGAVRKSELFDKIYQRTFSVVASRLSYDVLFGDDVSGNRLSGVTDITGRLGGTCPGLMLAIKQLLTGDEVGEVRSRLILEYDPTTYPDDDEMIFVNHATLSIRAKRL